MHRGGSSRRGPVAVTGRPQWESVLTVTAPLGDVWAVVDDLSLIPDYHPEVRNVQFLSGESRRREGVRYKCVVLEGRKGWSIEEVIEHVPYAYTKSATPEDSRGPGRSFDGLVTEISVEPEGSSATVVTIRAWYRPRGAYGRLANPLFLRRAMRRRAARTLEGLKTLVERRGAAP